MGLFRGELAGVSHEGDSPSVYVLAWAAIFAVTP